MDIFNGIDHNSSMGQVFNSKLGRIAILHSKFVAYKWPLVELKTQSKYSIVSLSLSMVLGLKINKE